MKFIKFEGPYKERTATLAINAEQVLFITGTTSPEGQPDTNVILDGGQKYTVHGTAEEVKEKLGIPLVGFPDYEGDIFYFNPLKIRAVSPLFNLPKEEPQEQVAIQFHSMSLDDLYIRVVGTVDAVVEALSAVITE